MVLRGMGQVGCCHCAGAHPQWVGVRELGLLPFVHFYFPDWRVGRDFGMPPVCDKQKCRHCCLRSCARCFPLRPLILTAPLCADVLISILWPRKQALAACLRLSSCSRPGTSTVLSPQQALAPTGDLPTSTCPFSPLPLSLFGQVCDEPHPLLVKEMIQHCVNSDIDEAYKVCLLLSKGPST